MDLLLDRVAFFIPNSSIKNRLNNNRRWTGRSEFLLGRRLKKRLVLMLCYCSWGRFLL